MGEIDGRVVIEVDDYELFDFVQDHLVEACELEPEFLDLPPAGPYRLFFAVSVPASTVTAAISMLDPSRWSASSRSTAGAAPPDGRPRQPC
jgi:hypothetical protein